MFGSNKATAELEQRLQEQFEKLAKYHQALQAIAQHVGVDLAGQPAPERSAVLICEGIDRLGGKEKEIEPGMETREISADVRNIRLDGCVELTIIQGDQPGITLRCKDKSNLSRVLTSVNGNTLTIDNEPTLITSSGVIMKAPVGQRIGSLPGSVQIFMGGNNVQIAGGCIGTSGPLAEVTVTLPEVSQLRIKGSGNASYRGFVQPELNLEISGSGSIDLGGTTERLEADISGSGQVEAFDLSTKAARLRISGSGEIRVTVAESIRARISGSGRIKVAGQPPLRDTEVSGSGKIKFVE